jgi:hypothetical protein
MQSTMEGKAAQLLRYDEPTLPKKEDDEIWTQKKEDFNGFANHWNFDQEPKASQCIEESPSPISRSCLSWSWVDSLLEG